MTSSGGRSGGERDEGINLGLLQRAGLGSVGAPITQRGGNYTDEKLILWVKFSSIWAGRLLADGDQSWNHSVGNYYKWPSKYISCTLHCFPVPIQFHNRKQEIAHCPYLGFGMCVVVHGYVMNS